LKQLSVDDFGNKRSILRVEGAVFGIKEWWTRKENEDQIQKSAGKMDRFHTKKKTRRKSKYSIIQNSILEKFLFLIFLILDR
jgi:hypothetical protein